MARGVMMVYCCLDHQTCHSSIVPEMTNIVFHVGRSYSLRLVVMSVWTDGCYASCSCVI